MPKTEMLLEEINIMIEERKMIVDRLCGMIEKYKEEKHSNSLIVHEYSLTK